MTTTLWLILAAHWLVVLNAVAVAVGCVRLAKKAHWTRNPTASPTTVWFIRHQYTGVLHTHPFAAPPTAAQIKAVTEALAKVHQRPKGKEPWWCRTVEVPILDADTLPLLPDKPPGEPGVVVAMQQFKVSATGKFRAKR